ncbi:uncharacterized protein PV09_00584 [Verruconis gallopava]|uniref:ribonuclease T1 n=1 Tax=Verruconis gallopava TaxID=253628 RepID=A0A0D2APL1_9PEZI|nr:uncharacterized protein PV09_00584 [Verruconis gallopava]KIW08628.1 hypothetical protein PV09_00584 [Verruconis gallopava]
MRFFLALPFIFSAATAIPTTLKVVARQSSTTCGSTSYSASDVLAAADAACQYVQDGTTAGGSKYPERYNDYEGFTFDGVDGPYYEFPILSDGEIYDGGSPGADRVVINGNCDFAGVITHTGADNNDFVGCSGTS